MDFSRNTIVIDKGIYKGKISANASKSYLQRALVLTALSNNECTISGYGVNNDTEAVIQSLRLLGVSVDVHGNQIHVKGNMNFNADVEVHCGESGLASRLFSALSLLFNQRLIIHAQGSLMNRSMNLIKSGLESLGKQVEFTAGGFPITIQGKVNASTVELDASESSQFLSGLLLVLPFCSSDFELKVNCLKSKPYIQVTLEILKDFGIEIHHSEMRTFFIKGNQKVNTNRYHVEGDWSGSAFHLVGGALTGWVQVMNLKTDSAQGDKAIIEVLKSVGAEVIVNSDSVSVTKKDLFAFDFDASDCPDLFPPLVALASGCEGISKIKGVHRLLNKESNRALSLKQEFSKLGINIQIVEDIMYVEGGEIQKGIVNSHNDHRIAMALAIAALRCQEGIEIIDCKAVEKSYPDFFRDFNSLKK